MRSRAGHETNEILAIELRRLSLDLLAEVVDGHVIDEKDVQRVLSMGVLRVQRCVLRTIGPGYAQFVGQGWIEHAVGGDVKLAADSNEIGLIASTWLRCRQVSQLLRIDMNGEIGW